MKKLGAQRLYKAVKSGDTSTTLLFLTSESKGLFSYQKVYEAWVEGGGKPDMLDALLQYEPFKKCKGHWHRRNKKNFDNYEFKFLANVLRRMQFVEVNNGPSVDRLIWMRDMVRVVVSHQKGKELLGDILSQQLNNAINTGKDWPWAIAAESRDLGWGVATYEYYRQEVNEAAISWFLDMYGPVTQADFEPYERYIKRFLEADKYQYLTQLLTPEMLKLFLKEQCEGYIEERIEKKKEYDALLAIAPWIEEEV